jgi:preprotein translocase subunit SecD
VVLVKEYGDPSRMTQRYINYLIAIFVIVAIALYIIWPNSPGIHLLSINKDFKTRLGLDLVGGVQAVLEADLPAETAIDAEAMRTATSIVENRVNGLGVTEAVVQQAGNRRVVVELPGETDPEKALATLKQTGLLEFVDFSQLNRTEIANLIDSKTKLTTDYGQSGNVQPSSVLTSTTNITSTSTLTNPLATLASRDYHTVMTGAELKNVRVITSQTAQYEISFELSDSGAKTFSDFTSAHVGDPLAIVLDKEVISAPTINQAITDGKGVISGQFTLESANNLAVQLRYGSLPIPLKVIEVRTVGPTLGQDSLHKSLLAGIVGFTIVVLFMLLYYRLPGVVADLAILIYALLAFAVFKFIPVTLTLPGIAGFLLSTGSALDANILIFERMKEELRSGKQLRQAIDLGWRRAWPSIRDSNIATLITCGILFWFGSTFGATIVKGFSVTLFLGVMISLFTAIVVTRAFMQFVLHNFISNNFEKWFGI